MLDTDSERRNMDKRIELLEETLLKKEKALEPLQNSEKRYRRLFESAKDGILILDVATGKIIDVNPFMTRLLGYPYETFCGKYIWEIGAFKDIAASKEAFRTLQDHEYVRYEDLPLQTREGKTVDVEFVSNIYMEDHTKVIQCNIRDITERKQSEERLKEAVQRLQLATTSGGIGIWDWDIQSDEIKWDDRMFELYGISKDTFPKCVDAWEKCLHPADYAAAMEAIQGAIQGEKELDTEFRVLRPDGQVKYLQANGIVIRDTGGKAIRMVGMTRDITDRRQVEEDLRDTADKLRALIEASPLAIMALSPDGKVTLWNRAAENTFGWTGEEALGASNPMVTEEKEEEFRLLRERVMKEGGFTGVEITRRKKGGSPIEIRLSTSPLRNSSDAVTGIMSIMEDVTERKNLEDQLRQSQKLESVGRLAGGIAHDFNNLMTIITGYSECLLSQLGESSPLGKDVEEIMRAGERAAALTRQLLAFSRRQVLQPRVLDLNDVVSDTEKMLRRLIGEDVELRTVLGTDPWKVKADPGQIGQVLMNLVVNAKDAMPKGGKLTIETSNVFLTNEYSQKHRPVEPGPYVLLAVSDTGVGMEEETMSHVFEPFFTSKEKGKGTGLGLSTVYGIVKQSGGYVWVYSEPGIGSTFKVYLPRTKDPKNVPYDAVLPAKDLRGDATVLVVEDDESIRKLACTFLGRYGYRVLSAENGEEALRVAGAHEEEIDLLLTDVVMPKMGGKDLYERLESLRSGIKVLYMSGYMDDAIVHQGVLEPGTAFLQKPYSSVSLAMKVKEVLDGK